MKDFDFKQLMLQKGEKIGLYVGLGVMALLLLFGGISSVKSDSPASVASVIQGKATAVLNHIDNDPAKSAEDISPEMKEKVTAPSVPPEKFPIKSPYYITNSMEDAKRRNPDVLKPDEFQTDLIRASVRFYDVITEGGKVKIGKLVAQEKVAENKAKVPTRRELYMQRLQEYYKRMGVQLPTPPQNSNMMSSRQLANLAKDSGEESKYRLEHVPIEQVDPTKEKLAITMYPARTVVVSASFPFKAQLEAYRRALRLPTLKDLLSEKEKDSVPVFLGINVQRRVVKPNTQMKEEEGWEDLDTTKDGMQWANYRWLMQRAVEPEVEDNDQAKAVILNKSMVMPRPKLGKDTDTYPPVKLKNISTTLAEYSKAAAKGKPSLGASPFNRRLSGEADIFNIEGSETPADMNVMTGDNKPIDFLPDHILMRFMDVTVKPGFTYEYRMQVRLTNPNYEKRDLVAYPYLAEVKELKAPWALIPKVQIPSEFYYYAVEEKPRQAFYDHDLLEVEMQRWLDYTRLNPAQRDTEVPVADWTIRKVPVHRGEYIGQMMDKTEVVIWYPTREVFDFAINPVVVRTPRPRGTPPPKGIPVDFSTNPRALLVDFEGGKGQTLAIRRAGEKIDSKITDDSSVELLILTEDGRLMVRNSKVDKENKERTDRYTAWDQQIKNIKENPVGIKKKEDGVFDTKPKN